MTPSLPPTPDLWDTLPVEVQAQVEADGLVRLSEYEARFPMVPTLSATPGVEGFRPEVGTRDCENLFHTSLP